MNTTKIVEEIQKKEKDLYELIENSDDLQGLAEKAGLLYNDLSRFKREYKKDNIVWSWKKINSVSRRAATLSADSLFRTASINRFRISMKL